MIKHHSLITGTGRAGTTFIMILLTKLGLDTGFTNENFRDGIFENCNAGLEKVVYEKDAPYLLKNPSFCDAIGKIIKDPNIKIDHVFIPIRKMEQAAKSRIAVTQKANAELNESENNIRQIPGGIWGTTDEKDQLFTLYSKLGNLLLVLSLSQIPVRFIHYPALSKRPRYLYRKLKPILKDISFPDFKKVFNETVQPELVNKY